MAETKLQAKEDAGEKGTEPIRVRFCFNKVMHIKRCFQWEDALFMEQAKFVTAQAIARPQSSGGLIILACLVM
jgi:hypothetical protein